MEKNENPNDNLNWIWGWLIIGAIVLLLICLADAMPMSSEAGIEFRNMPR